MNEQTRRFTVECVFIVSLICYSNQLQAQGLKIPTNNNAITGAIDAVDPTPYTAAELASPPSGQIRKLRLRDVELSKRTLQAVLASVSTEDQSNANYRVAQSAEVKLEAVLLTYQQDPFFSLIEIIFTLEASAESEGSPLFVRSASHALEEIKTSIVEEMADSIVRMNAAIPPDMLARFVSAFAKGSLIEAGDWEDKTIPISSAGVMILDAEAVVLQLKSQPWQQAERFVKNATAEQAFHRYTTSGDGLEVLKTKFAADKATIMAKWDELAAWVAQQRAANP